MSNLIAFAASADPNTMSAMTGKYSNDPYEGPYEIVSVHDNGTVRLRMGAIVDTVNIHLLHPYYE